MTNDERADRAYKALCFYLATDRRSAPLEDPDQAAVTDLITDLMHLFGRDVVEEAFRLATVRHSAEKNEEEDE
jgi:hypothetical protein